MAATDKISGEDGALTVAGGTSFVLTEWVANVSSGVIDVTDSSSSSWREKIPNGWSEWDFSAKGFLLDGTSTPTLGAAAAECVLTAESGLTYTGDAIINSKVISLGVETEEAVTVEVTGVGTGELTEANS